MIKEYIKGDLMDAPQELIMHGVNCAGSFGSGVAGAIKRKHPPVREAYLSLTEHILGTCQFVHHNDQTWANAHTQEKYGYDGGAYADLTAVAYCLIEVAEWMHDNNAVTIAMPKIGCGLGGLKWDQVEILVNELLQDYEVYVYEL